MAGPDQSEQNPLGIGGMRLHEWLFGLDVWHQSQGELHLVPTLLREGERLLGNVGELALEQVRAIEAPGVTHLKYRVDNRKRATT